LSKTTDIIAGSITTGYHRQLTEFIYGLKAVSLNVDRIGLQGGHTKFLRSNKFDGILGGHMNFEVGYRNLSA